MVSKHQLSILLLSLLALGCKDDVSSYKVKHRGALKAIMFGNLETTASLDSLSDRPFLYALGAVSGLKGEIQIFQGKPVISEATPEGVFIQNSFKTEAALLVYTEVKDWKTIPITSTAVTKKDLEQFVEKAAKEQQLEIDEPFPFLVEGIVTRLDWHVIDWDESNKQHTHQAHKEAGINGSEQEREVTVLGFFSKHHKAVFTHHTTFMHMHFITEDEKLAGHVDDIQLGKDMVLKLPKR